MQYLIPIIAYKETLCNSHHGRKMPGKAKFNSTVFSSHDPYTINTHPPKHNHALSYRFLTRQKRPKITSST